MGDRPRFRPDVVFRPLGPEWVLYDPESRKVHVLNATAALVWRLCDGEHRTEDMVRTLRETVEPSPDEATVRVDVRETIRTFRSEGLLL